MATAKKKEEAQPEGIVAKLSRIQAFLIAGKGQRNDFGKYSYRSCEDILEAVKPWLAAEKCAIRLDDDLVQIGDRYYVRSEATLCDSETGEHVSTHAFARESLTKKGMDESQITGSCSSYARKYALNGLLAIDNTKDADTMDNRKAGILEHVAPRLGEIEYDDGEEKMTLDQRRMSAKSTLMDFCGRNGFDPKNVGAAMVEKFGNKMDAMDAPQLDAAIQWVKLDYQPKSGDKVGGDIPGEIV